MARPPAFFKTAARGLGGRGSRAAQQRPWRLGSEPIETLDRQNKELPGQSAPDDLATLQPMWTSFPNRCLIRFGAMLRGGPRPILLRLRGSSGIEGAGGRIRRETCSRKRKDGGAARAAFLP